MSSALRHSKRWGMKLPNLRDAHLGWSEREFQDAVIKQAKRLGWKVCHFRPARMQSGKWSTPIQGHKGAPDLFLLRRGRWLHIELKAEKGRLSAEQKEWVEESIGEDGQPSILVFRPRDWGAIMRLLE